MIKANTRFIGKPFNKKPKYIIQGEFSMKKNLSVIEKKIKELEELETKSIFDFDIALKRGRELDKQILNQYEEIWQYVVDVCKKEGIKTKKEFNKAHPIFKGGLNSFMQEYLDRLSYNSEMDDKYIEPEIKFIEEVLSLIDLEEHMKKEYEIILIRDLHYIKQTERAEKLLKQWIKDYPDDSEGYNLQCEWELEKKRPSYSKIGKILDEVSKKGLQGIDEDIYHNIISHYDDIDDQEKVEHFIELYEEQEGTLEYISDLFEDDIDEEYEKAMEEEKQATLEELKILADDKIKKNKTIEQYIKEKDEKAVYQLVGPHIIFKEQEEIQEISKDTKKYLIENYLDVMKENIEYFPQTAIEELIKFPDSGILKINLGNPYTIRS